MRGSPAVNEFVWRMENDFSRNIRVVSRPSSRGRRREGGTRSSRIIYAVALRRANQRAPFFPSQTIFFFLAEDKASLLFFFFFSKRRDPPFFPWNFPFLPTFGILSFLLPLREIRGIKFFFTSNSNLVENEIFKTLPCIYLISIIRYTLIQF